MEIYCCKCNFISSFFSTALMMVITGSCPAVVPLLPSLFKKAITCAAQCQIHGSWLKYCLDTDKKGVKPFPNDLLSWLCSCITISYRMHSNLMPVMGNQGTLQSDNFLQSPVPCWHFISSQQAKASVSLALRKTRKYIFCTLNLSLSSIPSVKVSLMCRYKCLKFPWSQTMIIPTALAIGIEVPLCWYKATHI